jgi:hypothetical protein
MAEAPDIPGGGVDLRKYAAISLALGMARGALYSALFGDLDGAKKILDATALSKLAQAIGCSEGELAIDWNDHLTPTEVERIKGF